MKMFRQGDVMIRQVNELPVNAKTVDNEERIVLAYGEVTGHAHAIDIAEAIEFTFTDAKNAVHRFLEVASGAHVKHEEHATIELPPGIYEIIQQVEYTPEEIRAVAD